MTPEEIAVQNAKRLLDEKNVTVDSVLLGLFRAGVRVGYKNGYNEGWDKAEIEFGE